MPGSTSSSSSSDQDVKNCPGPKFLIVSSMNGKVLDIAGKKKGADVPVVMYRPKRLGGKNQLWYFDARGYIRSAFSGMTILAGKEGRPLKTSADFSDDMGKWKMDGEEIINEKGYLLDISGGKDSNGAEVCAYRRNGDKNQKWSLKYV